MSEYNKISKEVLKMTGQPKDYFEIAATLESMGYSDRRVKNEYGFENVFELSKKIFNSINKKQAHSNDYGRQHEQFIHQTSNIFIDVFRGILSVCPLLISMFSVFIINFSLWSFMDITKTSIEQATAIAFATILSMIAAGGFAQTFLRKGHALYERNYYKLLWKNYIEYLKVGLITAFAVGIILGFLGLFTGLYRVENIIIFNLYFILLTALWLSIPVVNLIKVEIMFVINLLVSIGLVYILKEILHINIIFSQVVAMIFFTALHMVTLWAVFKFFIKVKKGDSREWDYKPRVLINLYLIAPYFLYGLMYYILIFMDRLLAWTANSRVILDPVMRMKGDYELGMNWAIFAVIIPMVFIELYVKLFINKIFVAKKKFKITEERDFSRANTKSFFIYMIVFLIIGLFGSMISIGVINNIINVYNIELSPYFSNISTMVFVLAVIGYVLILGGLLNNIYLLYFSQGIYLLKAVGISIGVNFILGFLLSRMFEYYFTIFGFLAGAITFFVISLYYSYKVLKSVDYYFYKSS